MAYIWYKVACLSIYRPKHFGGLEIFLLYKHINKTKIRGHLYVKYENNISKSCINKICYIQSRKKTGKYPWYLPGPYLNGGHTGTCPPNIFCSIGWQHFEYKFCSVQETPFAYLLSVYLVGVFTVFS